MGQVDTWRWVRIFSLHSCSVCCDENLIFFIKVENLVERMVKWVKVGGFIFFRESCFHQSGDSKRKINPTHYREPRFYTQVRKWFCSFLPTYCVTMPSVVCLIYQRKTLPKFTFSHDFFQSTIFSWIYHWVQYQEERRGERESFYFSCKNRHLFLLYSH